MPRRVWIAFGVFGLLVALTWINPPWPMEQALHHSLTVLALLALAAVMRRGVLPYSSFLLVLVFLALHTVAARWLYSYVPYDDWTQALFGVRLSDQFGWERNNADRFVHFGYGVCLAPVLWGYFVERLDWRRGWAAVGAVDIVISTGAIYELFEWGIALLLAPDLAEAYNGQQGDSFDPHKDIAIAALGAILAVTVTLLVSTRRAVSRQPSRP